MFMLLFMEFVAFPDRSDGIIAKHVTSNKASDINIDVSGSIGYYNNGKCIQTHPNETLFSDKKHDWCSNVAKSKEDRPWIMYNIKNKAMRLTGYAVRNGCCYYDCCCTEDSNIIDYNCCCRLYSFSLQGSNDNVTWKTIHKVDKERDIYYCEFKNYEIGKKTESFNFIRFMLEEEYPGCPACMQVNQIELYGEEVASSFISQDMEDNDESVSIIGKVRKQNQE